MVRTITEDEDKRVAGVWEEVISRSARSPE